ncbi:MAG: hypothetical protein GYA33_05560 [Thermogutta sp.]|nr:hypothetical protein [Thermogutta sp.]
MEWYCRLVSTGQVLGPITGRDLKNLAEQGQVGPQDMVGQSPDGPWHPAAQVRGLFAVAEPAALPSASVRNEGRATPPDPTIARSPAVAAPPAYAAPIPLPMASRVEPEADFEDSAALAEIRRKKLLQKKRRRKLIQALAAAFLVANAVLLAVILRPRGGASPNAADEPRRTTGDQASEQLKPLDTADLDSLLAGTGTSAAARSAQHSDLAAAAAAFGDSLRKLSHQIGNIRIVIEKIEQGYPELRQGGTRAWPATPVLVLTLAISNVGEGTAVNYRGWKASPETAYFSLTPTGPRIAELRSFGPTVEVVGSAGPSRLGPGDSLRDVLVFTLPEEQAETLYCTLVGDPVGAEGGQFQFIIPSKDIVEMPVPPEVAKRLRRAAVPDQRATAAGEDGGIGPIPADGPSQSTSPQPSTEEDKPFGNEPIPIPGIKTDAADDGEGTL